MGSSRGTVLYDDACGVCRRLIAAAEPRLRRHGFDSAPLQSPGLAGKLGMSENELLHDIRLLTPEGDVVHAADVYRYVMRRIWWAWPVWFLSILPGLNWLFDRLYRTIARNRQLLSRACGLHPPRR